MPLRLLLIEDSEDDALLQVLELRKGGFDPDFARVETPQELEVALNGNNWDAVICDYNMTAFTGIDALRIIQTKGLDIPFILVSGVIGEELAVEALKAGAHDYIMKGSFSRLAPALERELRDADVRLERRKAVEELQRSHYELETRVRQSTAELVQVNEALRAEIARHKDMEVELRESRQRLMDIIQFCPDATMVIDSGGKVIAWNRAMEELTGVRADEMLGRGEYEYALPFYGERRPILIDQVTKPDEEVDKKYSRIKRTGGRLVGEAYFQNKRGEVIYFHATAASLCNSVGKIVGAIESIRDISERKRMEDKLHTLSCAIEQSPVSIVITDREGTIEYVNSKFTLLTGFTSVEAIGQIHRILKSGKIPAEDYQQLWETILSGGEWNGILYNKKKSGELYWESASISPVVDSEGDITHFIAVKEDITNRKIMEEELRKAKDTAEEYAQRLELALEGANDAAWEWDMITNQRILNARYYEMTGYTPGELNSDFAFFMKTIHPDDVSEVKKRVTEHLEGKTDKFEASYRMVSKSGQIKHVMGRGKIVKRDEVGRPTKMAGVATDVTEQKRLDDEVRRMHNLESIGLLAGGLAHDFNNLLNVIYGNITFARIHAESNAAVVEPLTDAEEACERAREFGLRLQAFAQGSFTVMEQVELPVLIRDIAEILLMGSHISHSIYAAYNIRPVEADPRQIRQVFENLLTNAKEAMSDGGTVRIAIEHCVVDVNMGLPLASGCYVCIALQDNGKGIPEENLTKIFNPYFSTKDTYSQRGLGLGLSICHAILKKHSGHIAVESRLRIGTRVTVYLPAAIDDTKLSAGESQGVNSICAD